MKPHLRNYTLLALLALLTFAVACTETEQANKLIEEGNAMITEANKMSEEAGTKYGKLLDNMTDENFSEEQAKSKSDINAAADAFGKSAEKYRAAAKKFEEASKMKVDDKFKEYLSFKAQEFNKNADGSEAAQALVKALADSADGAAFKAKIAELKPKVDQLSKEATEFQQKAEKIRTENKDKFKS